MKHEDDDHDDDDDAEEQMDYKQIISIATKLFPLLKDVRCIRINTKRCIKFCQ